MLEINDEIEWSTYGSGQAITLNNRRLELSVGVISPVKAWAKGSIDGTRILRIRQIRKPIRHFSIELEGASQGYLAHNSWRDQVMKLEMVDGRVFYASYSGRDAIGINSDRFRYRFSVVDKEYEPVCETFLRTGSWSGSWTFRDLRKRETDLDMLILAAVSLFLAKVVINELPEFHISG